MALFDRSASLVTGPLACYAAGFAAELSARGWSTDSVYRHLWLMRELSAWMSAQGLDAGQLSPAAAERFVPVMRVTRRRLASVRALAPMLGYLRDRGVLPEPDVAPASERDALLAAYQQYLRGERGLSEATVRTYTWFAAAFLDRAGDPLREVLAGLTGPDVLGILERQLRSQPRRRSAGSAVLTAQVARSLLRFLHASGRVPRDLAPAVPRVARWRLAGLPARVDVATMTALLDSCDRAAEAGRRDYAVLLVYGRLGLRSADTARLTLDDFNWRAGEITIRGKGGRTDTFPLPWDVGEAVAGYLRDRRHAAGRAVFLTVLPPFRGLAPSGLGAVVHSACRRAGVPECGPHTLRHSLASGLLAAGASLSEVGEILRHSDPRTTAIYAKVDRTALASLVRPWPAEAAS
ncbi:MAG: tyrosine-type recombinase/integrase [Streptosporangiaceae bacterium]